MNHLAVERGPIVYCAEFADNGGTVLNYVLKPETAFEAAPASMLGGVEILKGTTERIIAENDFKEIKSVTDSILLIPYYARSHRGMVKWLCGFLPMRIY